VRKRRRHRAFAAAGKTFVTAVNNRLAIPAKCIVVGHLCPVEVSVKPSAGGSVCTIDVHCPEEVSVVLWTSAGSTVVHTNAQVHTTCRVAAVELRDKIASHATICTGTDKAALWRVSSFATNRPGLTVWVAPLPLCRYVVLVYDTLVGWVCPTCGNTWPTAQGLLNHLRFTPGTVDQLVAGKRTRATPPIFTVPVAPRPRQYNTHTINPAVLRGRLLRAVQPTARVQTPRLTIGPHW
jgi:hypothetical protein